MFSGQFFRPLIKMHSVLAAIDRAEAARRRELTRALMETNHTIKKDHNIIAVLSGLFNGGAGLLTIGGVFTADPITKTLDGLGKLFDGTSKAASSGQEGTIAKNNALNRELELRRSEFDRQEERREQERRSIINHAEEVMRKLSEAHRIATGG